MNTTAEFPRMHVSLYVSDIAKTTEFYTALFGQAPDKIKSGYTRFTIPKPALVISFLENAERVQSNFGHLGIQLETLKEVTERLENLKPLGLVSKEEMGVYCCYALQDKFWATDPDGHQWEMYYFHEDVEFNDPKYAAEDATACCTPEEKVAAKSEAAAVADACCAPNSNCC